MDKEFGFSATTIFVYTSLKAAWTLAFAVYYPY
jgi:hypothetical protein